MKTIITKPIINLTTEYLSAEMLYDILGNSEEQCKEIFEEDTNTLNDPIKIDSLRRLLNQLEQNGANYVSINYHSDHGELELSGLSVNLATEEEIKSNEQKDIEFQKHYCRAQIEKANNNLNLFNKRLKELSGE